MNSGISVTGVGAVTAQGMDLKRIFNSLLANRTGISRIKSFNTDSFPVGLAAEVDLSDWMKTQSPRKLARLDPSAMMALIASEEAMRQSMLLEAGIPTKRIGLFWASGNGGIRSLDKGWAEIQNSRNPLHVGPFFQSNVLPDHAGARLAAHFGIKGPVQTVVSACASGNAALLTAMAYLRMNWIDAAITGGSEAAVTPSVLAGFSAMKALSINPDVSRAVLPFSKERNGFLIGEGAACMVLERTNQAESRAVKLLANLSGGALLNEAGHITNPDAEAAIASDVICYAIEHAGLRPDEIDLIYAHGTGTKAGDASEYRAYRNVWKENLARIPVITTKHNTGHLLGASASLEAALAVKMIEKQTLLPGHKNAGNDPEMQMPALFIPQVPVEIRLQHVLNYAAGFGGQQSAVVISAIN